VNDVVLPSANGLVPLFVSVATASCRVTVGEAVEVVPEAFEVVPAADVDFALVLTLELAFDELMLDDFGAAAIWALRRSCQAVSCAAWTCASLFLNGAACSPRTPGAHTVTARRTAKDARILSEMRTEREGRFGAFALSL
jgi:hypothetical protein